MATRNAETFAKKFKPVLDAHGEIIVSPEPTVPMNSKHLWTLIDPMVESGQQYWVPSFHYVNRNGYTVTDVPWTEADLQDEYRRW